MSITTASSASPCETKGRVDEAIVEGKKVVELEPKSAEAHYNLGLALKAKGDLDGAERAFREAVRLEGEKHGIAIDQLAELLASRGKLKEAIATYQKIISLDPKSALGHWHLGWVLRDKGRTGEAITECRKAIELNPQDDDAHNHLGWALGNEGRGDEAIAECRKAIELNPRSVYAHDILGVALRDKGRVDEAIAELKKATELSPQFGGPHYHLGIALRDQGRVDEAIAELKKADELDPNLSWSHYHLGLALRDEGRVDEAIAVFEERIRRRPDWYEAHFGLAAALAAAKQWDRSASVYAAALKRFGADIWPGPWPEAIRSDEVFTRLTAQQPDDLRPWMMRARLHVFQRDWKRAATDYGRLNEALASVEPAELLPEGDDLVAHGCLLLLLGDRDGYEQFCKKWTDRVGDSPAWGYHLAHAWAVSPPSGRPRAADRRAG